MPARINICACQVCEDDRKNWNCTEIKKNSNVAKALEQGRFRYVLRYCGQHGIPNVPILDIVKPSEQCKLAQQLIQYVLALQLDAYNEQIKKQKQLSKLASMYSPPTAPFRLQPIALFFVYPPTIVN